MAKDYTQEELEAMQNEQIDSVQTTGNRTLPNMGDYRKMQYIASGAEEFGRGLLRNSEMGPKLSQSQKNQIEQKALGGLNGTEEGFKTFAMTYFMQIINYVVTLGRYSDEMLKDLVITQTRLDRLLMLNRSLAIVKQEEDGKFYALTYIVEEFDIYGLPSKIKIIPTNLDFNGKKTAKNERFIDKVYSEGEFAILEGSPELMPKWLLQLPSLKAWFRAQSELNRGIDYCGSHLYRAKLKTTDVQALEESHQNDFMQSSQKIQLEKIEEDDGVPSNGDAGVNIKYDAWQKSFMLITMADNYTQIQGTADYFMNLTNEIVGISTTRNSDKKERMISGEIDRQQDRARANHVSMVQLREESIDRIHDVFPETKLWDYVPNDFDNEMEGDPDGSGELSTERAATKKLNVTS